MEQAIPTPDDDEALLTDLRHVTNELDLIPEHVLAAARAAIGRRTIDAELAELIADSAVDEPARARRTPDAALAAADHQTASVAQRALGMNPIELDYAMAAGFVCFGEGLAASATAGDSTA